MRGAAMFMVNVRNYKSFGSLSQNRKMTSILGSVWFRAERDEMFVR